MFSFLRSTSVGKNLLVLSSTHLIVDFFTGIWPIYKTLSGLDIATAGLLAGISGFLGESLQMFFGYFCDQGHRKKILLLGLLMSSCILWVPFVQSLPACFLLLLCLNIGSGSFHPAGVGYAGSLTVEHKAKTILCFAAAGLIGLASSQMIFAKLLSSGTGYLTLLLIPVALVARWIYSHSFPHPTSSKRSSFKEMISSLSRQRKTLSLLYFSQLSSYGLILGFVFLLPDVLLAKAQTSWLSLGGGHFCFILGGALSLPFMGSLCDRFGPKKIILCALSVGCLLFYLFAFLPALGSFFGACLLLLLGASLNSVNPMIVSWGHKVAPDSPSTVSALLMGLAWCFSYLGPIGVGALYKRFSEQAETQTLLWLGCLLAISWGLTFFIPSEEARSLSKQATA